MGVFTERYGCYPEQRDIGTRVRVVYRGTHERKGVNGILLALTDDRIEIEEVPGVVHIFNVREPSRKMTRRPKQGSFVGAMVIQRASGK